MVDEYILKETVFNYLKHHSAFKSKSEIMQDIAECEPADVAPVVHAYWEGEETDCNIKCHKCGKAFRGYIISQDYVDLSEYPEFCPNCGAKMDKE